MNQKKNSIIQDIEFAIDGVAVAKIVSNISEYEGKEVYVVGKVSQSINILGMKGFKMYDPSNPKFELIVFPGEMAAPEVNSTLKIKGKIKQIFKVGDHNIIALYM